MVNNDRYLITACTDRELRVWKITFLDNKKIEFDAAVTNASDFSEEIEESVDTDMVLVHFFTDRTPAILFIKDL